MRRRFKLVVGSGLGRGERLLPVKRDFAAALDVMDGRSCCSARSLGLTLSRSES